MKEQPGEERFANALDAIVTGTVVRESDALVAFARTIQPEDGGDALDAERRASIWSTLMSSRPSTPAAGGGAGPLAQPALALPANPWAQRPEKRGRFRSRQSGIIAPLPVAQRFLTAMAVVAIALAAWTGLATFNEDSAPPVTPTASAHGVVPATPEGSPAADKACEKAFASPRVSSPTGGNQSASDDAIARSAWAMVSCAASLPGTPTPVP